MSPRTLPFHLVALLAGAPLAASQGQVWTVGPAGMADFETIQLAVHAAADGDFVFVEVGAYPSFVVHDKALTVVASPQAAVQCGTIRVRDLAAGKACVFRGLQATGLSDAGGVQSSGAYVAQCAGAVWFEGCTLRSSSQVDGYGAPALEVVTCANVAVSGGTVLGGTGTWTGGHGIAALDSRLALYDVEVHGAQDGNGCTGPDGGDGARCSGASFLFASGGSIHGGDGTDTGCDESCAGDGGNGITLLDASTAELSQVDVEGGWGGLDDTICWPCCDGSHGGGIVGGPVLQYGASPRTLETPRLLHPGDQDQVVFQGVTGDRAFLLVSSRPDFVPIPGWSGVSLLYKPGAPMGVDGSSPGLPLPLDFGSRFLGVVPASGVLAVPLDALDPPDEAGGTFVQAYAVDAGGTPVVGQPSRLFVVRSDLPMPDCNGNGVADPDDVSNGTSADCDGNGVPDECDVFPDCNQNGINDLCDVAGGASFDCNADGVPDECQEDCNANGLPDDCDLANGTSLDCDSDAVPDECEAFVDCNANGLFDDCDIASGTSLDVNGDGVPDECQFVRLFVDADAPPGGDGLGWTTAYRELRDALADPTVASWRELWVAEGTYTPAPVGSEDVQAAFTLSDGDSLYGGFAGDEVALEARDPRAHPTILSGDLHQDDEPGFLHRGDNSRHVVVGTDASFVLDGFSVRGGYNTYPLDGAGLYARPAGVCRVANCRFVDNRAGTGGGAELWCDQLSVVNCEFVQNLASNDGGGLHVFTNFGPASLVNCVFLGNFGGSHGSGLTLHSNGDWGAELAGCTFTRNEGGTAAISIYGSIQAPARLASCILWRNSREGTADPGEAEQINTLGAGSYEIRYSCIQGLASIPGPGNIGIDPRFVDRLGPDGVPGTADDDLRLAWNSPCVDAGDNGSLPPDQADLDRDGNVGETVPLDLDQLPRRADDPAIPDTGAGTAPIVDMGAYERQGP